MRRILLAVLLAALVAPPARAVDPTPQAIGAHYAGLLDGLVYDQADPDAGLALQKAGLRSLRARTLMRSDRDRRRLAEEVLAFAVRAIEIVGRRPNGQENHSPLDIHTHD